MDVMSLEAPRRPMRVQSLRFRPVLPAHLSSSFSADNPARMSSLQTQPMEEFMAGKHSDAKRIKQIDNPYGKEDFTSFLQLPLTCT